ncbi:uncharacterized protein K02A2.6-like, partial [Heteronotia binoei]|uniref:uncharacterized protein K02A2.6-like n=1 Tax=Heteronotia binoei TaxID=13085 RepID=UPI00292F7BB8
QAFLGLLNFYHAFLPHKAAVAEPLHRLLDKNRPWAWGRQHAKAFQDIKGLLMSNSVLAHFDETLPLVLACDASPYGVGAVLGHRLPDGTEVPIAYYSRTLSSAERNYAQIDKEGLAVVAGVKTFHDYIYGRPFTLYTDHKPLLGELSTHKGCLLWGNRVVIPKPLQDQVLRALHEAHPGIVRMKALARSYVWWPGLDAEIEAWVKRCLTCQVSRPDPPRGPVQPWESTKNPWSRLHMDFAGPFHGRTLLILVDSYSKWLEVVQMPSPSSQATIMALRAIFATHGLPETIVTDNGTAFTSAVFQDFLARNLIRHIRSAPFHPATNGQAERMVRTAKEALNRLGPSDWPKDLACFLMAYRTTPTASTGRSPAELLMGRRITTLLDKLHPDRA